MRRGVAEEDLLGEDDAGDLGWPGQARDIIRELLRAGLDIVRQIVLHDEGQRRVIEGVERVDEQLGGHEGEEGRGGVPALRVDEFDGLAHGLIERLLIGGEGTH